MLFELEDVTVTRGGDRVLDAVDLRLAQGASCIVGPSGAGKSTLLRLLNRLVDPDAGRVLLPRAATFANLTRSPCVARSAWCRSCRRWPTAPWPRTSRWDRDWQAGERTCRGRWTWPG